MNPHADLIDILQAKLDNEDKRPSVPGAPNGDRNAVTVEHAVMDRVLAIEAFQGPGWSTIHTARHHPAAAGSISTEYGGIWIRGILIELRKADKIDKKKGGE